MEKSHKIQKLFRHNKKQQHHKESIEHEKVCAVKKMLKSSSKEREILYTNISDKKTIIIFHKITDHSTTSSRVPISTANDSIIRVIKYRVEIWLLGALITNEDSDPRSTRLVLQPAIPKLWTTIINSKYHIFIIGRGRITYNTCFTAALLINFTKKAPKIDDYVLISMK